MLSCDGRTAESNITVVDRNRDVIKTGSEAGQIVIPPGVQWIATLYNAPVIKSFRHKGLQRFFETGAKAGIQAMHAARLRLQLAALDQAKRPSDMGAANWVLHPLRGALEGHWSVRVSGNWRLTFRFEGSDAILVDYRDYH